MDLFFVPANSPEDWKPLLAQPEKHWKTGYSAKTLAYCWHTAQGFPNSVLKVFKSSGIEVFKNIKMLAAFPEYKVSLPPFDGHPSQSDVFVLAKSNDKLVSIAVEGKALEGFGETINEWGKDKSSGKETRLNYLLNLLALNNSEIGICKYQLLHRTASAIIEADTFNAKVALMLVHSFSDDQQAFSDYKQFLNLFGLTNAPENSLIFGKQIGGIELYFAWVNGEKKYLSV